MLPHRETGSLGSDYVRVGISYLWTMWQYIQCSLVCIVKGTGQFWYVHCRLVTLQQLNLLTLKSYQVQYNHQTAFWVESHSASHSLLSPLNPPSPPPLLSSPPPLPLPLPLICPDRLAEGMRELETILDKRDMVLCAPMLLIYAHKRCKTIGKRRITALYTWIALFPGLMRVGYLKHGLSKMLP